MRLYWFRVRALIQLTRGKFGPRELQEGKCENTGKRMLHKDRDTRRPRDNRDRDRSDASTNEGSPRAASTHQKLDRGQSLHREHSLSDTLISNI